MSSKRIRGCCLIRIRNVIVWPRIINCGTNQDSWFKLIHQGKCTLIWDWWRCKVNRCKVCLTTRKVMYQRNCIVLIDYIKIVLSSTSWWCWISECFTLWNIIRRGALKNYPIVVYWVLSTWSNNHICCCINIFKSYPVVKIIVSIWSRVLPIRLAISNVK